MATRNFILTSVAGLALAGSMLASAPGFAQYAEQIETDRLNTAQAAPTPVAPAPADQAAYNAALADHNKAIAEHNQAQANYNAQLRDYQAKQRAYNQEQRNYDTRAQAYGVQSDIYQDESAIYDRTGGAIVDPPDRTIVVVPGDRLTFPGGHARLIELAELEDPNLEIANMPVEDRRGNIVGHFDHLTFQDSNIPKAVITLNNRKKVVVGDEHFRYDPDEAVVVADLTFDELDAMPARF